MLRALVEFRIRGVKVRVKLLLLWNNIDLNLVDQHSLSLPSPYSRYLHRWKDMDDSMFHTKYFLHGSHFLVKFIDDTPDLFKLVQSQNRAQKLLAYLGDLAVNGSSIKGQTVS